MASSKKTYLWFVYLYNGMASSKKTYLWFVYLFIYTMVWLTLRKQNISKLYFDNIMKYKLVLYRMEILHVQWLNGKHTLHKKGQQYKRLS